METETGFAEINGAKIYYEVAGDGLPLVMIHAGIADSRMWDDQFAAFAPDYRVVRYDQRGFGKSEPAPGKFSRHENLHGLLKHLNIERAILMGCSMGGSAAIDFALEYPQMTAGLILVGAGLSGFEWADWVQPEPEIEAQAAFEAGDYEKAAEIEAEMWVAGVGRTAADVDQAVLDKVREMNLVALCYEALKLRETQYLDPPAFPCLGEIRVPTLVIVGENDWPDIFAIADALTEKISGAQKIIMPGTAHVPNMEKPAEFNQHVRTFLNGLNPA